MTKTEQGKRQDMLDAIYSIFAEIDPDTTEEVENIIRAAGIDPDDYATKTRNLAQNTLEEEARQRIDVARQKYDSEKSTIIGERQTVIQTIREMMARLSNQQRAAFAYHRNLESESDSDLQSLLDDLSYLDSSSEQE